MAYTLNMTSQEVYPRPALRDDGNLEYPPTDQTITWITSIDESRLWADFVAKLAIYQRTHAVGSDRSKVLYP